MTSLGAENWTKNLVKSSAVRGAGLQTESVNKRNVSRELNQDKNVVEEVVNQRKILKDLVPANTFKLENMKVNLVNKNHVGKHSKLPTNSINGPDKLEKTHFKNKINHSVTDPDQNSQFIPFINKRLPLVPVLNHQSWNQNTAARQSFLYNSVSPTFGPLPPPLTSYHTLLSSFGPFLQTHNLLFYHPPPVYPRYITG